MPKRPLPRIRSVDLASAPWTLRVTWDGGEIGDVDVSGHLAAYRVYAPMRGDQALFALARVGDHGTDVVWTDELDMSADVLWRLAQEQSGLPISPKAFKAWRRRAYTLDGAARALGLGRRSIAYYETGAKPIPRVVALAAKALDKG
jgi:hypothetical protein